MIIGFGTSSASDAYTTTSSNSLSEMLWRHDTLLFAATGSSTLLSFGSLATDGNCCYGPALDNVSVTAVPEATTWAVLLLGFLGVGFVAYRRKSTSALYIA
jgi:hypothetical protein